jgi:hypothetical protein
MPLQRATANGIIVVIIIVAAIRGRLPLVESSTTFMHIGDELLWFICENEVFHNIAVIINTIVPVRIVISRLLAILHEQYWYDKRHYHGTNQRWWWWWWAEEWFDTLITIVLLAL